MTVGDVKTPLSVLGYLGVVDKLQYLITQPLKCMLVDNDYVPDFGEDASITNVSEYEITHENYPPGGLALENLVLEPTGEGYKITCNDIVFENANYASYHAIIYNSADSQILTIITFKDDEGNPKMVEASNAPFTVDPSGNAIFDVSINYKSEEA